MIGGGIGISFQDQYFNVDAAPATMPIQGFSNGTRVRFVLAVQDNDFNIDFRTPDGIVLHFNPRFDQGEVVLNSISNGGWETEEIYPIPFKRNHVYTVEFVSNGGIITIFVNGNHFADFVERSSSQNVHLIHTEGAVHIHSAHIIH